MLYVHCQEFVQNRIEAIEKAMQSAQEAANDDTKSSAGDKYETTRSMMQLDKMMNTKQLAEATALKHNLRSIDITTLPTTVKIGSLILTQTTNYFVAIGVGKVLINAIPYFIISPASPIAIALMGKQINDTVAFNKQTITITHIL